MDIEQEKKNFLSLLRSCYQAGLTNNSNLHLLIPNYKFDPKRVYIKEKVLNQYGLGGENFWYIICPSLKQEGYLESFDDPNYAPNITRREYYERFPDYADKIKKIKELSKKLTPAVNFSRLVKDPNNDHDEEMRKTILEIDKYEKELAQVKEWADNNFPHAFIVNEEKILNKDVKIEPEVKQLSDGDKKKLYILEKLKNRWDIASEIQDSRYNRRIGLANRDQQTGKKIRFSWKNHTLWQQECRIDYYELTDILNSLKVEGLLVEFETINPGR